MVVNYLVLALTIIVVSFMIMFTVIGIMAFKPSYDYKVAFILRDALTRGYANMPEGLSVTLEERDFMIDSCIDGVNYTFPLKRVLVLYEASGSPGSPQNPFEEGLPTLWKVWGNSTHAGVISSVDVIENGVHLIITYVATDISHSNGCLVVTQAADTYVGHLFSRNFGLIAVNGNVIYTWKGYREVRLRKLKVVFCGS
ncbi:MAG: hypothetical protein QXY49_01710 [Thermofilaceae archaeon]